MVRNGAPRSIKAWLTVCFSLALVREISRASSPAKAAPVELTETERANLMDRIAKLICIKDKPIMLRSIDQMQRLIRHVHHHQDLCPGYYLGAFFELDALLKLPASELCNDHAFNLFKAYHFRYISPPKFVSGRGTKNSHTRRKIVSGQLHPEPADYSVQLDELSQRIAIPLALRHFFLIFGLQLSAFCKLQLLVNLEKDARDLVDPAHLELVNMFTSTDELSGELENVNFDNVVYLQELEGRRAEFEPIGESVKTTTSSDGSTMKDQSPGIGESLPMYQQPLQVPPSPAEKVIVRASPVEQKALFDLVDICRTKLAPIYSRLILPVVKLSKLGYDYLGSKLSERDRAKLDGKEVCNWLIVTHNCELFSKVLVLEPEVEPIPETPEKNLSLVKGKDDADVEDELHQHKMVEGDVEIEAMTEIEAAKVELNSFEYKTAELPLDYEPRVKIPFDRKLWILNSSSLDLELSRKKGYSNPFGFKGFCRLSGNWIKKQLAILDPNRSANYRRHSAAYAGLLNFVSCFANIASITVTLFFIFG